MNGMGSDATLLIYDAKARKVFSLNAEGTAPKLATIEWYKTHQNGKIPVDDSLLAGHRSGGGGRLVYPAFEAGARRASPKCWRRPSRWPSAAFPSGHALNSAGAPEISHQLAASSRRPTAARGRTARSGRIPTWPAPGAGWWRPRRRRRPRAAQAALKAARDLFYKGDIAREMAKFSEENGGLFRYEDFAEYSAKLEEPVSIDYRGYTVYKNPSATPGSRGVVRAQHSGRLRPQADGPEFGRLHPHHGGSHEAGDGGSRPYLGDMDFIQIPYRGLLSKEYAAERRKLIDPAKASLEFRPGDVDAVRRRGLQARERPRDVDLRGRRRPRGRHQLHRRGGSRPQHDFVHAQPAQRLRDQGGGRAAWASSSIAAAIIIRWFPATPTRSRPASGRAARCKARW